MFCIKRGERRKELKKKIENIVYKSVDELIPYINNPRDNENAVDAVASSIKNFGFKVPIVIDSENEIINGHTRLKAAKKLGIEEVPCIVADDLSEAQIKAFRLADNKVSELASWNYELLESELSEISNIDMSSLGFEDMEFEDYIDEMDYLSSTKGEADSFNVSFEFPKQDEDIILKYIDKVTKDVIVERIIEEAINNA